MNSIFLRSANADERDLTTGSFKWYFNPPLQFADRRDKTLHIGINRFTYTNFFDNIITSSNDTIYYSDDTLDETKYSIVLPQGSYDVISMNNYIQNELTANGHTGLFSIQPDYSLNKVYVLWGPTLTGWFITLTTASPYVILGYNLTAGKDYIPTGKSNTANEVNYADDQAAFNNVTSIGVKMNLGAAIMTDGAYSNVMTISVPDVGIGYVMNDEPINISYADCRNLQGVPLSFITANIVDQNDAALAMAEDIVLKLAILYI